MKLSGCSILLLLIGLLWLAVRLTAPPSSPGAQSASSASSLPGAQSASSASSSDLTQLCKARSAVLAHFQPRCAPGTDIDYSTPTTTVIPVLDDAGASHKEIQVTFVVAGSGGHRAAGFCPTRTLYKVRLNYAATQILRIETCPLR